MENPQKPTKLSPRSHSRHLVGKRTAQRDINKDITSDSQVNSYFPYWWSPASLTFNIYFYLFLYLTRITINNNTPHLKSPKNQNRRAALGRPAIFILKTLIVNNICYSSHVIRNTREVIFHTTLLEELKQSSVMTKKMIKKDGGSKNVPQTTKISITSYRRRNKESSHTITKRFNKLSTKSDETVIPFVSTYNPNNPEMFRIIEENQHILERSDTMKEIMNSKEIF